MTVKTSNQRRWPRSRAAFRARPRSAAAAAPRDRGAGEDDGGRAEITDRRPGSAGTADPRSRTSSRTAPSSDASSLETSAGERRRVRRTWSTGSTAARRLKNNRHPANNSGRSTGGAIGAGAPRLEACRTIGPDVERCDEDGGRRGQRRWTSMRLRGLRAMLHPVWWTSQWWKRHRWVPLSLSLGPPIAYSSMWWI